MISEALSSRDDFWNLLSPSGIRILFSGSVGGVGYAESNVFLARDGFWLWYVKIAPVVLGTFLRVLVGMRRNFDGIGISSVSFSGFCGICEVRASSRFEGASSYVGPYGYLACCNSEYFSGRRCTRHKKYYMMNIDILELNFYIDLRARFGDPSIEILYIMLCKYLR